MLDDSGDDEDYDDGMQGDYYQIAWEDTPSGISSIAKDGSSASDHIYSLSGQRVYSGTQAVGSLPKGIYIHDGKKVVVK